MKRWPVVRHVRALFLSWRVHLWARRWGAVGVGAGVPDPADLERINHIWLGEDGIPEAPAACTDWQRADPLRAYVTDGRLLVAIGIDTLARSFEECPELQECDDEGDWSPRVLDIDAFAKDVLGKLRAESETGENHIHRMLDAAFQDCCEWPVESVEYPFEQRERARKDRRDG